MAVSRLKRRDEFLRVAAGRRKHAVPGLVLQVLRRAEDGRAEDGGDPGADACRVGFTVSRKVGGAVERNRVKPRLRAAVERVFPEHALPGTASVVFGSRPALARD